MEIQVLRQMVIRNNAPNYNMFPNKITKTKKNREDCFRNKVTTNLMLSVKMTHICHEVKTLETLDINHFDLRTAFS